MKKTRGKIPDYPFEIRTLTPEEGGGYLISYPDFDGCFGDGETVEEAMADGKKALAAVIDALEAEGLPVPKPGSAAAFSGKFVQRLPKTLHARLHAQAEKEGVSINTLAISYIAAGLAGHSVCSEKSASYRSRAGKRPGGKAK